MGGGAGGGDRQRQRQPAAQARQLDDRVRFGGRAGGLAGPGSSWRVRGGGRMPGAGRRWGGGAGRGPVGGARWRSILVGQVGDVMVATVESGPGKDTHWSRASMARRTGLSKSTVGRIWRKFDLKPHLQGSFKLSTDPFFVEKVVDVVGLYHNPPEKAVVLCVDEKSQIQALDRSQPVLPMMPGLPERRTH